MKTTHAFATIIAILFCPLTVFATKQINEKLSYNDRDMAMFSTPLDSYLATLESQPSFEPTTEKNHSYPLMAGHISTSCRRGYVGEWEIKSGKLFCKGIYVGGGIVDIDRIFPGKTSPAFASWCSSVLEVRDGQLLEDFQPPNFVEVYSKKTYLFVSHGNVLREVSIEVGDVQRGIVDFDAAVSLVKKQENPDAELIKDAESVRKELMKYEENATAYKQTIPGTHIVRYGESIGYVIKRYNIPIRTLKEMNPDVDWQRLQVGQKLNVGKLPELNETKVLEIAKRVAVDEGMTVEIMKFSLPVCQEDGGWRVSYEDIPGMPGGHGTLCIDANGNFTRILPGK